MPLTARMANNRLLLNSVLRREKITGAFASSDWSGAASVNTLVAKASHAACRRRLTEVNISAFVALLLSFHFAHCMDQTDRPKCNVNGSTQESNACVYDELRADQRKGLKAHDPQCKEDSKDMEGTTDWVSEFYGCVASATKERTQQLRDWTSR
jgi:uncharacterized protein YecT (DUF1311 family)